MKRTIFNLFFLLAGAVCMQAQEFILSGTVLDQDGQPVVGAQVALNGSGFSGQASTDADGRYQIGLEDKDGIYIISAYADGYTSITEGPEIKPSENSVCDLVLYNALNYKEGKRYTIILPVTPDSLAGRYFRLDRVEGGNIIFEREFSPQANVPYVFYPNKDFRIDLREMDLSKEAGQTLITVTDEKVGSRDAAYFMGSYSYINFSDILERDTPVYFDDDYNGYKYGRHAFHIDAMHATLLWNWHAFDEPFQAYYQAPSFIFHDPKATDHHPFIEEGKVWRVAHLRNEIIPGDYWTESYYLGEDTIISDVRCKKMMHGDNQYAGAVHEEGMKVGYFAPGSQAESLLYDFGVKVGDVVEPLMGWSVDYDTYTCVVTDVVTIQHGDENLRCIFLSSQDERTGDDPYSIFGIWIEGIGSTTGPVIDIPLIMMPISQTLIGCSVGEKEIYRSGLSQAVHYAIQEVTARKTGNAYRPFIEEGKEWKVGQIYGVGNTAEALEYYYFDGDTIIDERSCKKMYCRHQYINGDQREEYVGAVNETNKCVYLVMPGSSKFYLIYDFVSPNETIEIYNRNVANFIEYIQATIVKREMIMSERFKGMITDISVKTPLGKDRDGNYIYGNDTKDYWMEGVGSAHRPVDNCVIVPGYYSSLMSCTVGDEVLYYDPSKIDGVTPDVGGDVKKNWLDFTHTVKTKPKAPSMNGKWTARPNGTLDPSRMNNGALGPARRSATLDPSRTGRLTPQECSATSDEETVTGEYSVKELFVNFKTLAGPYTITVTDAAGQPIYNKVVQTSNVVALNTDISTYPKGEYTITVENEEKMYTAEFNIKDEDGLTPNPSPVGEGNYVGEGGAGVVYDLSGRRIVNSKSETLPLGGVGGGLSKGIYIINGRKVVVR